MELDCVDKHARDFLGLVTVAGNQLLSSLVEAFHLRGSPTLRTVLNIRKVRQFLPQPQLEGARFIALAADGLRHLTLSKVKSVTSCIVGLLQTQGPKELRMPHYHDLVQHVASTPDL